MENDKYHKQLHDRMREQITTNQKRINSHSDRLKLIEIQSTRTETTLQNLCEQIKDLVATIKWAGVFLTTVLVGFFLWYIQTL